MDRLRACACSTRHSTVVSGIYWVEYQTVDISNSKPNRDLVRNEKGYPFLSRRFRRLAHITCFFVFWPLTGKPCVSSQHRLYIHSHVHGLLSPGGENGKKKIGRGSVPGRVFFPGRCPKPSTSRDYRANRSSSQYPVSSWPSQTRVL